MGSGRILYARRPLPARRAVAPDHAGAMNDMLHTAVEAGTGRRARLARHVVAGKTGTTQDFRDAWFIGYTAHATAAVWVGNDNGRPMERVAGGTLPAEIWQRVMTAAHAGLEPRALPGIDNAPRQPVPLRKIPRDPPAAPAADPSHSGRATRLPGATLGSMTLIDKPPETVATPGHDAPPRPDRIDDDFVRRAINGVAPIAPDRPEQSRLAGFPPRRP
jgi:penicillin-binding protein 1A